MQLIPGGDQGRKLLAAPALAPPPPSFDASEIREEREKRRREELARRGRRSTILTSGRGVDDALGTINRPEARAANLLGQ